MEQSNHRAQSSAFIVASIALSIPVWQIAFNLGVYETVFYEHLFIILAVSIAALFASYFVRRQDDSHRRQWLERVLFLLPSLWLITEIMTHGLVTPAATAIRFTLAFLTGLISLPFIIYYLVMAMTPGVDRLNSGRLKAGLVTIALVIAVIGYLAGHYHSYVLSCDDFRLSGNFIPEDCWNPGEE